MTHSESDKVPQNTAEGTELTIDLLVTGDRPSILYFGMVGAHAIRKDELAIFMVDAKGRVCLMPPSSVQILERPRIKEEELNALPEEEAIHLLLKQGDNDDQIMQYLGRRPPHP